MSHLHKLIGSLSGKCILSVEVTGLSGLLCGSSNKQDCVLEEDTDTIVHAGGGGGRGCASLTAIKHSETFL